MQVGPTYAMNLLPSAIKLRRLCFYRCVSVHGEYLVPGGVLLLGGVLWGDRLGSIYTELIAYDAGRAHLCYEFITVCNKVAKVMFLQVCVCPLGVPGPGGVLLPGNVLWGGCLVGGLVSQHAMRQTPPGETATAAGGTHPTGMHSCCLCEGRAYWQWTHRLR